ncbi:type IV pilus twitching motility protein PilT [Roseiconus lacunae]|uniref:type IV pilus twitching motility protein PilT n=1 Tax=Roseiconus lacunae TaxID=2605694 RepID=UPI001E3A6DF7|nr:PilT/PilU family type 4a pilus ATPase [Roseiconus lacunae]MCD0462439.1 PilT/PilU family type 4a pilus ATPase [Roseiconus lacunae]
MSSASELLKELLTHCVKTGASDLHLSPGQPPFYRADGRLNRELAWPVLSGDDVLQLACVLAGSDLEGWSQGAIDGATSEAGGRFRFNLYRKQKETAIAIRRLDEHIRPLVELGLPDSLYELSDLKDGLVIVAGPTGSGKSTTLATLIDRINRDHQVHIITIEDPIEYLHPSQKSLVNQRQIGIDSESFNDALVASLRQDPDVILVGEIREIETIRTAITAAETGHLVFATVHAPDCVGVIERITSVFPADEQSGVRRQLALVLKAVIAQHLLVADGAKVEADEKAGSRQVARRVLASEIMRVNSAIGNLIASGKSAQILSSIESGASAGMRTLDQNLAELMLAGMISERTATAYAQNPQIVQDRLMRLKRGGGRIGLMRAEGHR